MAKAAMVITKREFEQLQKDRRSRAADIAVLLAGLVLFTGGVGLVFGLEENIPPQTDWSVNWVVEDVGGKACSAKALVIVPCPLGQIPGKVSNAFISEGETQTFSVAVGDRNITKMRVGLSWVDDLVDYEGWTSDKKPSGAELNESWDCLTLTVEGPGGETGSGSHCGGDNSGDNGTAGGLIVLEFPFTPAPNQTTAHGKKHEVLAGLAKQETRNGLGEWTFTVTLDYAGDRRGNVSQPLCAQAAFPGPQCADLSAALQERDNDCVEQPFCEGTRVDSSNEWYMDIKWSTYRLAGVN